MANIAPAARAIGLLEAALAALVGRSPREHVLAGRARATSMRSDASRSRSSPAGLPSGLLERRPDIRRVEAELAAANLASTSRARDYYPSISLTALFGSRVGCARRTCSAARR